MKNTKTNKTSYFNVGCFAKLLTRIIIIEYRLKQIQRSMRRKRAENTKFCNIFKRTKACNSYAQKPRSLGTYLEDQWKYE